METADVTPAAASETTATAAAKPNTAALAAIDNARASRGASVKRPPRNAAPAAAPVASPAPDSPAPTAPAAPADEKPRRKKPSGRKPTRAELAAEVKRLRAMEGRGEPAAAPIAQPAAAPAAPSTVIAGDEEAKATFAKGVARFLTAAGRFVARRKGAHWIVKPEEAEAFGDAAADCLEATEEMAPVVTPWIRGAARLAPFGVLAAVSYELVDSRMEIEQKIEAGQMERTPLVETPAPRLVKVVDAPR